MRMGRDSDGWKKKMKGKKIKRQRRERRERN